MQATLRECTVLKMNQKFHRGEDKRVTIIQRFKLFRDYRPESKRVEPRFSAAGNYECRWKRGRRQTEREKSGRYQEGMKKKRKQGENAILRVYIGFLRPVQEFVRVRVFDFKASLLGRYNRTVRTFSRLLLGPSEVGTHENILHFLPRFTRCILWRLDWKSIPRDCVIGADSGNLADGQNDTSYRLLVLSLIPSSLSGYADLSP